MKKKKYRWYLDWKILTAIPTSFAAIWFIANGIVTFGKLPERVEAGEQKQYKVEQILEEQQALNKKIADELGWSEPLKSPDGKWFWDQKLEKWRPIGELKKNEDH